MEKFRNWMRWEIVIEDAKFVVLMKSSSTRQTFKQALIWNKIRILILPIVHPLLCTWSKVVCKVLKCKCLQKASDYHQQV